MSDRKEYLSEPRWYVAHTYSGYENKVQTNLLQSIKNLHYEEKIFRVEVPMQEVVETKDGKTRTVKKKLFPGYVLVHMIMDDDTWYVVRNTRGVTGFVGPESKPIPLTPEEMAPFGITDDPETESEEKEVVYEIDVEVGDTVTVASGAWEGWEGIVKSINTSKGIVAISIDMFGRETTVEMSFLDIRKL